MVQERVRAALGQKAGMQQALSPMQGSSSMWPSWHRHMVRFERSGKQWQARRVRGPRSGRARVFCQVERRMRCDARGVIVE